MATNENIVLKKKSFLSFQLGEEFFAIHVKKVVEVLQIQEVTPVPKSADYIKGIVNFRGDILPVVETRIKFNMPETQAPKKVIIVLDIQIRDKQLLIGAIADGVKDVIQIAESEIVPVPEEGSYYNSRFLEGMVKHQDNFIMILNINKVFSLEELDLISEKTES